MALLNVQTVAMDGTVITFAAAAGAGDSVINSGRVELRIRNASGAPKNVTIEGPGVDNFGISHATAFDLTVSIPAAAGGIPGEKTMGPFPANRFNDAQGRVQIAYPGGETDLSVAAVAV